MNKNFKLFNLKLANSSLIDDLSLKKINSSLVAIAIRIKKALKIVQKFHLSKKKIIFVGNPLYINKQLNVVFKKSKHVFIPRSAWVAGHITNRFAKSKKLLHSGYDRTKLFSIHKLKKKSSLVIIIDELRDSIALNEHHSKRIPIIAVNSQINMLNETSAYKIPAKMTPIKAELNLSMFYSLLLSVLKMARTKKYLRYRTYLTKKKPNFFKFNKNRRFNNSQNKKLNSSRNYNFLKKIPQTIFKFRKTI